MPSNGFGGRSRGDDGFDMSRGFRDALDSQKSSHGRGGDRGDDSYDMSKGFRDALNSQKPGLGSKGGSGSGNDEKKGTFDFSNSFGLLSFLALFIPGLRELSLAGRALFGIGTGILASKADKALGTTVAEYGIENGSTFIRFGTGGKTAVAPGSPATVTKNQSRASRNAALFGGGRDRGVEHRADANLAAKGGNKDAASSQKLTAARGESKEDKTLAASRKRRMGRGSSSILTGALGVTGAPNKMRRPSLLGS